MEDPRDVHSEESPNYLVRITGFSTKTTVDALFNFFENTRRSGGGEIKDIKLNQEESFVDILFWSSEDAQRVVQKESLELDGANLTATLKKIPKELPIDQKRLCVMGINDKTTKDGLILYMEVVSGGEVESMLFGSNFNAMVTFKEPPDLEKVEKKCSTRALDGSHLKIEQVNLCDCIEVSGLAPNTTNDTILYYFENPKKGGGDVRSVELDLKKARALVFFEDPSVVNDVTKVNHVLNDVELTVVPYYPFLGETSLNPGGGKKEKNVKVDPQTMIFINKFFRKEFDQLLEETCVNYKWEEGSREIILGCVDPKMVKEQWENSCEAVVFYVNQIVTEKITVSQEAWKEMCDKAKDKYDSFRDRVEIICKQKELSFTLRGIKTDVCALTDQLNDLHSEIKQQISFEKNKSTKKISLTESQIDLLSFSGFAEDLKRRFKDLEVTMIKKELAIHFRGPDAAVREGNTAVWQTLAKVKEFEMELPKSIVGILGSDAGKVFLTTKLMKNNIEAVISFDVNSDTQLMVTAVDRRDMKKAVNMIKDLISEQSVPLDEDQKQLIHSEKWMQLRIAIQQSSLLQITEEPGSSSLWIAGIKDEVDKAKERVEVFFDESTILNKIVMTEAGRVKFMFKYEMPSIKKIEDSLKNHSLKVTMKSEEDNEANGVVLNGNREGIEKAVPRVEKLLNDIKDRNIVIDQTGMRGLEDNSEWLKFVDSAENKYKIIVELSIDDEYCCEGPTEFKIFAADDTTLNKVEDDITVFLKNYKKEEIPTEIPKDLNKLHVVGVSDKTTKDGLMSFMEAASGGEVESMLYGSYSNAMVTFKEPPDLKKVEKKCSTRALDGSHLKIEQVNICDCIEVSGLAPNTTKDTILYYFENPKKGGGDVRSVELDAKKARALVFFEDPSVVNDATKVNHVLNGAELTVVPYYPFLGETSLNPGGGKKEKVVKVDPQTMIFINKFFRKEFDQLLEKTCVNYKWEEGSWEIILWCVNPKMVKEQWENSCEAVASYVNQIVTEKITVSQEAWKEMCDKAKDKYDSFRDRVEISRKEKELSFTLRGMKSDVCVLAKQMNDLNSEIEKKIAYERNKISKKISLTEAQIELLSFSGFVEDLKERFKDLEVTMMKREQVIHFRGPDPEVREGNIAYWQTLSRVREFEVELPKSIAFILGSDAGKVFMATKFKKSNIDAVISFDGNSDTQLTVTAVDRRDMKKAVDLIKDLTAEQSFRLDKDQEQIIQSEKWKQYKTSIQQSKLVQITEEPVSSTLWIAGIKDEVDKAKDKIALFFKENIILDKVVKTENGRVKFVFKYKAVDVKNIEVSLKTQSVKVKKYYEDDEGGRVVVSGTREGIEKALVKFEKLINDIKDRRVDLDKPGMKKFFSAKKGSVLLSIIENNHNCIIERCTPSSGIESSLRFLLAPEDNMWLQVFASSNKDLNKAEKDINELMKEHSRTKEIEHKAIGKLSNAQRERVLKIETKHDTKIQIDKKINRIVVRGVAEDVSNTTLAIYDILNEKSAEEHARRYAELLCKNVQWYYVDGDDVEPYDSETNAKIEQAYKDNKPHVVFFLEGEHTRYRIDFSTNIETNLDTGETTRVERRDTAAGKILNFFVDKQQRQSISC